MALSSTKIIKVIVITDNLDKTVQAYQMLLGTGKEPENEGEICKIRAPYTRYHGQEVSGLKLKVKSVYSDNFWFECIQPLEENDPWSDWLKEHGPSIMSVCLLSDGAIENDEAIMKEAGYESVFKQEKGWEAYEYFDTTKDLGVMVEVKEHYTSEKEN